MRWWEKYKVSVPEGMVGDWRVERFEVTADEAAIENMRMTFKPGMAGRVVTPGTYTRLMYGDTLVMSDTPAEISDHSSIIHRAKGDVLVHGLGLGVVVGACLAKDEVDCVTVVERASEVIELVALHYRERYCDRLEIIEGDAFTWKPARGRRWNYAWHDIWSYITPDNLPEMHKLHRRFGRRVDWQGSWCRTLCEMYR